MTITIAEIVHRHDSMPLCMRRSRPRSLFGASAADWTSFVYPFLDRPLSISSDVTTTPVFQCLFLVSSHWPGRTYSMGYGGGPYGPPAPRVHPCRVRPRGPAEQSDLGSIASGSAIRPTVQVGHWEADACKVH